MTQIELRDANAGDVEQLAIIFDQYRVFYSKASNVSGAKAFLTKRFEEGNSTILVATFDQQIVGFTQLYPTFSSLRMSKILILNDLFVIQDYRKHGVGSMLLKAATEFASREGFAVLTLQTELNNDQARSVYAKNGWVLDTEHVYYSFEP